MEGKTVYFVNLSSVISNVNNLNTKNFIWKSFIYVKQIKL